MFTPKDIENFNKIYHLVKTSGYTLDGAKKALKSKQTVNDSIDLKDSKDLNNSTKMNENNDSLVQKLEEIKQKLIRLKNEQ
jgi:DNA-binding transcriptional MerR regulator